MKRNTDHELADEPSNVVTAGQELRAVGLVLEKHFGRELIEARAAVQKADDTSAAEPA